MDKFNGLKYKLIIDKDNCVIGKTKNTLKRKPLRRVKIGGEEFRSYLSHGARLVDVEDYLNMLVTFEV